MQKILKLLKWYYVEVEHISRKFENYLLRHLALKYLVFTINKISRGDKKKVFTLILLCFKQLLPNYSNKKYFSMYPYCTIDTVF